MDREEIAWLFQYCSPKSIFVVTWYGKLKTLNCPFTVKVKKKVGNLTEGSYEKVDEVKLSSSGKMVFVVDGDAYYYFYFDILTHL